MRSIPASQLLEQLNWRYAVKKFDVNKKIDTSTWQAIERALVLSPSSYGLQPWRFLVVTNAELKDKLPEVSWKQTQPKDCSHMVVLAARKSIDEAYIHRYMQHVVDTRELASNAMDGYRDILVSTVGKIDNHLDWNARQVYIALGQLMVACAMLGVDTCPMEGIVPEAYDELLGLKDSDYTTVVGCACGYRDASDPGASSSKVRFPAEQVVQHV